MSPSVLDKEVDLSLFYKVFCGIPATKPETKPLDRKWIVFNTADVLPRHVFAEKDFNAPDLKDDKNVGLKVLFAIRVHRKFSTYADKQNYGVNLNLFHGLNWYLHDHTKFPVLI